jgi:hypothetical protein
MYWWRITKYNPQNRDSSGLYLTSEWTSFSDIGKCFNGTILTRNDYMVIENLYVDAVISFAEALGVYSVYATSFEESDFQSPNCIQKNGINTADVLFKIKHNRVLYFEEMKLVIRMILREMIWCKLESNSHLKIHFGYDYYMYIGVSNYSKAKSIISKIQASGLFVECYESPYEKEKNNDLIQ